MNISKIKNWVSSHKILTGFLVFIFLIIIMPGTPSEKKVSDTSKEVKVDVKQEIKMVFDVPSYFGKSIEEITSIIGTPTKNEEPTKEQLKTLNVETWEKLYTKDGYNLMVEFNLKTRKVISFFIDRNGELTDDNKKELEIVSNTVPESKSYISKMVPVMNTKSKFTGLLIKDKQVSIDEWDSLIDLSKKARIVYKDVKQIGGVDAYEIYVDTMWYVMKIDMKKDVVAKFSMIKQDITGYKNIKFKDSNNGEVVAEVTAFGGSIEIYK